MTIHYKIIYVLYNIAINSVVFFITLYYTALGKKGLLSTKLFNNKQPIKTTNYIWLHASSVGESILSFAAVKEILLTNSNYSLVVTTHTETSKQLWQKEFAPEVATGRLIHYYLPLDAKFVVNKFLNYFQFKLVLWIESDFWPNYLQSLTARNIPVILLNARMSSRSFKRWQMVKSFIVNIMQSFSIVLPDSKASYKRFQCFVDTSKLSFLGNLKYVRENPKLTTSEVSIIKQSLANRLAILAISTHKGEELMLANIHLQLKLQFPNLVSVIIPRHINRVDDIIKELEPLALNVQRFSANNTIEKNTDIVIVDALNKVFLFSSVINIAYVGKSMFAYNKGGHNLLEPLSAGAFTIFGSYMNNFQEIAANAVNKGVALEVNNASELNKQLAYLLTNPELVESEKESRIAFVAEQTAVKHKVMEIINNYLS